MKLMQKSKKFFSKFKIVIEIGEDVFCHIKSQYYDKAINPRILMHQEKN
jgi:hypothetical protein